MESKILGKNTLQHITYVLECGQLKAMATSGFGMTIFPSWRRIRAGVPRGRFGYPDRDPDLRGEDGSAAENLKRQPKPVVYIAQ